MAALSVFTVTSATAAGTVATYTGTITSGRTPLIVGMPIIVTGFVTHTNFNGFFVISGGNLTTTFTATIPSTTATDTHAATATVDPEGVGVEPSDVTGFYLGYGYNRENPNVAVTSGISGTGIGIGNSLVLGNYVPGTLPGGGQQTIEF